MRDTSQTKKFLVTDMKDYLDQALPHKRAIVQYKYSNAMKSSYTADFDRQKRG